MKKLVLTLGIVLMGIIFVQAQETAGIADKKAAAIVNQMMTTAHLTSDQASKITPFVKQFIQEKMDNTRKFSNDPAGLQHATQINRQQLKSNLKTVLSDDQMKQITAYYANKQQATPSSTSYAPKGNK